MASFDYQDIISIELIKLVNEKAIQSENNYIKKAYKYDYLLQINLSTVNGLTLKIEEGLLRPTIANVFIKVTNYHFVI